MILTNMTEFILTCLQVVTVAFIRLHSVFMQVDNNCQCGKYQRYVLDHIHPSTETNQSASLTLLKHSFNGICDTIMAIYPNRIYRLFNIYQEQIKFIF